MTIKEFVSKYNEAQDKEKFIKKHITTNYVGFAIKLIDCQKMIERSCYTEIDSVKKFRINSVARYLLYVLTLLSRYTDVEIDFEHAMDSYDQLCEAGLIAGIINFIPAEEINEYQTVLNMMLDDVMENERSIIGWVENKQEVLSKILEQISLMDISGDINEEENNS